jgi:A/G-specific adenine glycosylase
VASALSRRGRRLPQAPRLPSRGGARLPDPLRIRQFGRRLRAWYRRNARDLPWRRTRDPYAILVSELMLQQTQVSRVLEFYPRFLSRFPSLESLAGARETQVVRAWEGLGYYARARNLHKLSRAVVREGAAAWGDTTEATADRGPSPNGKSTLPRDPDQLRRLPGIGAYTAGAVASFAFEWRAALVDTNVARVLSRVFAPRLEPKRSRDQKAIWALAAASLPRTGRATWTHNQALMELGALVCTARVKRCAACPLRSLCATYAAGTRAAARSSSRA